MGVQSDLHIAPQGDLGYHLVAISDLIAFLAVADLLRDLRVLSCRLCTSAALRSFPNGIYDLYGYSKGAEVMDWKSI